LDWGFPCMPQTAGQPSKRAHQHHSFLMTWGHFEIRKFGFVELLCGIVSARDSMQGKEKQLWEIHTNRSRF
jgi:hypothetical protein